jgi:hypothetical protein
MIPPARHLALRCALLFLGASQTLLAHRTEGLLQSALVDVKADHVSVQVTLALGVDIAPGFADLLDPDGDDAASPAEIDAWSRDFLATQAVTLDGDPLPLTHGATQHSPVATMRATPDGHSEVRIRFSAATGPLSPGPHHITHFNGYQALPSTCQTHGVVPDTAAIRITRHTRAKDEREITLEVEAPAAVCPEAKTSPPSASRSEGTKPTRVLIAIGFAALFLKLLVHLAAKLRKQG